MDVAEQHRQGEEVGRGASVTWIGPQSPSGPEAERAAGFGDFYRLHYLTFVRLATLLTGSSADAEDLVQEAFTSVASRFGRLDTPVTYMRTAVINLARRRYRDDKAHRSRLLLLPVPGVSPDEQIPLDLIDIIATLPFRQRVVIVGRYWGGWSEEETARILGCRPGTVKSLRSRAITTLRRHIEASEL
jgi:DNA-directed RNA polymerase specialized sigma24 family protein